MKKIDVLEMRSVVAGRRSGWTEVFDFFNIFELNSKTGDGTESFEFRFKGLGMLIITFNKTSNGRWFDFADIKGIGFYSKHKGLGFNFGTVDFE